VRRERQVCIRDRFSDKEWLGWSPASRALYDMWQAIREYVESLASRLAEPVEVD